MIKNNNKNVIQIILFVKCIVLFVIFFAYSLLPFASLIFYGNFHYPQQQTITLLSAYQTWDAQHYLYLVEKGYGVVTESARFYPLFPWILSLTHIMIKNNVINGLLVSNMISACGVVFFYHFSLKILKQKEQAYQSVLLLLCFPTAFYFSLIYSESLFLLLTCAFFYYLYSKKYFLAALFAFFIPISRPVGVFIIIPYITYFFSYTYPLQKGLRTDIAPLVTNKHVYLLISPVLGFFVYLLFMYVSTGNAFASFSMANTVVSRWDIQNIIHPLVFFHNFFTPHIGLHGFTNSLLDRIFFVIYCVSLWPLYKKFDKTLFSYALCMGMVPLFGSFMSYTRYLLLVFPLFFLWAKILEEKKNQTLTFGIYYSCISLEMLFLVMHSLNYWVA